MGANRRLQPFYGWASYRSVMPNRVYRCMGTLIIGGQHIPARAVGGQKGGSGLRRYRVIQNTGIRNLLLFGRGSYDYKKYLVYNKNFVPTYESRNSLSPLQTYSSDDYFGFLETNEGNGLKSRKRFASAVRTVS